MPGALLPASGTADRGVARDTVPRVGRAWATCNYPTDSVAPRLPFRARIVRRRGFAPCLCLIISDDDEIHGGGRSEEHTSELQSHSDLVCRLLLEKKKEETDAK